MRNYKELVDPMFFEGIAHRGLHNDEYCENGMKAFQNALDHKVAIELDIHLTKDNELIVCHNHDLEVTTGKKGLIEELTLKEIKSNYKLLDGGEVPTYEEVLDLIQERVVIVTELKVYQKNYKELANRTKKALEKVKNKKMICLISFDPRSLWSFKRSGYLRALLIGKNQKPDTWFFHNTTESLDLDQLMFDEKRVLKYHASKRLINAWTIRNKEQLDKVLPYADTITFENMDVEVVRSALREKNKNNG